MKWIQGTGALFLIASLVACSSGSSSSTENVIDQPVDGSTGGDAVVDPVQPMGTGVSMIGTVNVSRSTSNSGEFLTPSATFELYDPPLTDFTLPSIFAPTAEDCRFGVDIAIPRGSNAAFFLVTTEATRQEIFDRGFESQIQNVSAGEVLDFTGPDGTFGQLDRNVITNNFVQYILPNGSIAGPAPDSLVLDIPGDVFPAMPDVEFPIVDALKWTGPPGGTGGVASDETITWEAGTKPDTVVLIKAQANDFSLSPPRSVETLCVTPDDGSFDFPSDIQAAMQGDSTEPAFITSFSIERLKYQTIRNDNVLLILQGTATDNFPSAD